jgi:hypothetical protein
VSNADVFAAVLIFSLGLFTSLAGLFTAYFGAGKSRAIGFSLIVFGIIALAAFAVLTWDVIGAIDPPFPSDEVITGLVAVFAAFVGSIAALIIFLVSIMRA